MFDDVKKDNNQNQAGQPGPQGKIEDIFSNTDQAAAKPDVFKPKESAPSSAPAPFSEETTNLGMGGFFKGAAFKKILFLAGMVVVIAVLALGSWKIFNAFFNKAEVPASQEEQATIEEKNEANKTGDVGQENINQELPATEVEIDTDQDGLTDEEEFQLGMDINSVDSDNDGLFDREEVKVYKTDPLNPDTDGDGMSDGDEVKNMRNPKGEGNLFAGQDQAASQPSQPDLPKPDTDGDGLTDDQERERGTRFDLRDSDEDGLSDYEEAMVYNTDPLNPDTDGDGHKDGDEVKNGYNPNGEGAL
ncbi:hypothetical protein COV49_02600 [Candidatus Falkowbacteria bacterium CG11_big_fil_rev_8_21_14_0_20_39_10]|uniref:Uncharacterized protein n=1 Tax=Candidatus Falkowbacteria bacterium CG11_big_fil_rev_8_21_14_0_20_39_10 TaxID=1974570 RepID=A0A2M6K8V2_9BACT|nr:MAG: hypothetical protein COV49_02600 [Candidatus Falkowbacteria bacterium CG11_big_fil_rev_8_21_14_0_20_39_10]